MIRPRIFFFYLRLHVRDFLNSSLCKHYLIIAERLIEWLSYTIGK